MTAKTTTMTPAGGGASVTVMNDQVETMERRGWTAELPKPKPKPKPPTAGQMKLKPVEKAD